MQEVDLFPNIKKTISRLGEILSQDAVVSEKDEELFGEAATELAVLALEFPGRHLKTLQQLKRLSEGIETSDKALAETRQGLLRALPNPDSNPAKTALFLSEIDQLLLKELDLND